MSAWMESWGWIVLCAVPCTCMAVLICAIIINLAVSFIADTRDIISDMTGDPE